MPQTYPTICSLDSLGYHIKYLKMRKLDFNVWKEMGRTFLRSFDSYRKKRNNEGPPSRSCLGRQLAMICFLRARIIAESSTWPSIDFVRKRYMKEKTEL